MGDLDMGNVRVGISACILGEPVRYDGGLKLDRYIRDVLGRDFEFVPTCPEFEAGFGVPREAVHLVGDPDNPRLVTVETGLELTEAMETWFTRRLDELERERLSGFIFKARSPSCALSSLPIHDEAGFPIAMGAGLFTRAFKARFPTLPLVDEEMLHDPRLRKDFLSRCKQR